MEFVSRLGSVLNKVNALAVLDEAGYAHVGAPANGTVMQQILDSDGGYICCNVHSC